MPVRDLYLKLDVPYEHDDLPLGLKMFKFPDLFFTPFVLAFLTLGVMCLLELFVHCPIVCFSCGTCEMACASRLSQAMNQILMQLL